MNAVEPWIFDDVEVRTKAVALGAGTTSTLNNVPSVIAAPFSLKIAHSPPLKVVYQTPIGLSS